LVDSLQCTGNEHMHELHQSIYELRAMKMSPYKR